MSWNDYYARRKVLNTVLKAARNAPDGPLPFAEIPRAEELFGAPEQLALALYYRWNLVLLGRLRSTVGGPEDAHDAPRDEPERPELVAKAWRRTLAENPTLRAVLDAQVDAYPAALEPALEREQRLLAITAGLAEPHEPTEEVTQVGAGFMAMLREDSPAESARRPKLRRRSGGLRRLLSAAS